MSEVREELNKIEFKKTTIQQLDIKRTCCVIVTLKRYNQCLLLPADSQGVIVT